MSDWDATSYDRFAAPRQRPCRDLLAAVPAIDAQRVTDLGCGSGLSTALLASRWPQAKIDGIDSSPTMLDSAGDRVPTATFAAGDIRDWAPEEPRDLILANASLQWIPDHRRLLPRLLSMLASGGVLAVQMPNNLDEPSHRLMRVTADGPRYRQYMQSLSWEREDLLPLETYYDCLASPGARVEIWETRYQHVLPGAGAIVDWFSSTALKPFLGVLPPPEQSAFRRDYLAALEQAYPRRADGQVLLGMPRLFIVAQRRK